MARFVALHQTENRIVSIPLGSSISFGRKGSCQVLETDLAVSGIHCNVCCSEISGGILVEVSDSSSNGTYVNDRLVGKGKTIVINPGDIIDLAKPKDEGGRRVPKVRYQIGRAHV
jgi:pSer/pThr/pTyr-binding forkhead associated (FHA) protein